MKFVSWNVNGLRAVCAKGFNDIFASLDADFFCIQETKLSPGAFELKFEGYESYWNLADRKGYSGTAVFTRLTPQNVTYGIGVDEHDHEGRVITLEMDDYYLVNVYTPNSQGELARLPYRMKWEEAFREYLSKLDKVKPVVICGDMNVAHKEIDPFRALHPNMEDAYTWWSYRARSREKNVGWRIDYFLISERLRSRLLDANIRADISGSDHCPVEMILA